MAIIRKLIIAVFALLAIGIVSLAVAMRYTSACGPATTETAGPGTVRAIQYGCYGSPEVLELVQVSKPALSDDEVLVRIKAASVNPLDWHYMRGSPYVMRFMSGIGAPKDNRLGADFAGVVESVGKNVTTFDVGDRVFGIGSGAFGDYLTKHVDGSIAKIPENATFAQGAALPVAGVTALQALRDYGHLNPGDHVLVNGASGGVGTHAVQIAKAYGAVVTGVSSQRNHDMVLSIGADHVIDYRTTDYTEGDRQYDLIVDMIGNHGLRANAKVLKPGGRLVIVGGKKGDWIGPLNNMIKLPFVTPFVDHEIVVMMAHPSGDDLQSLAELMAEGKLVPVIDKTYALSDVPAAIAYSEEGRARGKILIEIGE